MDEAIGFVGLGHMGSPMAGHLVQRGYRVLAWDHDAAARERFATQSGAAPIVDASELGRADILITMLPTGDIVRQVLAGLSACLRPGSLVIDTTSSEPEGTRQLGAMLAARGIAMVDAPVSGARKGALEASLVFMVGGDDAAVERANASLSVLGSRLIRTGPLGSGHAMKALNNFVSAAGFAAACEALVIGRQFGLDDGVMTEVLNQSTGRNFATKVSLPRIVSRDFNGTFSLGLFTKDTRIAADMAEASGVTAPISQVVHARMAEAVARLGGNGDHTTAMLHWETQVRRPA